MDWLLPSPFINFYLPHSLTFSLSHSLRFFFILIFLSHNWFELFIHFLVVSENLHSPKSITNSNTQTQTNKTVFPRTFSGRKNPQTNHETSKSEKASTKSTKCSRVILVIKLGSIEVTKLIGWEDWGMFFNEMLFFFHIRVSVS